MVKIGIDFDALGKGVLDWGCRGVSEDLYISVLVWVCTRAHRDQRSMTDVFLGHSSPYFLRPGLTEPGAHWFDHAVHQPHLGILLPRFLQCWDDVSLSTTPVDGFWGLKVGSWYAWQELHQLCHFPTQNAFNRHHRESPLGWHVNSGTDWCHNTQYYLTTCTGRFRDLRREN